MHAALEIQLSATNGRIMHCGGTNASQLPLSWV